MIKENDVNFEMTEKCHICSKLYDKNDVKIRDRCHMTGKCRGFTHESFNCNFWLTNKIPVTYDNLRGYDGHHMM